MLSEEIDVSADGKLNDGIEVPGKAIEVWTDGKLGDRIETPAEGTEIDGF